MISAMPFSPFDRGSFPRQRGRFRLIPVRTLVPNLITLLALCAGLTAIRLALEDKLEWAVAAIVFAALLDGIDGRVARMLRGTSRFGAELDSLADFVNFGVAPALMLYFWGLRELGNLGWIAGLVFAISTGLRLARFNVMVDDPNKPAWAATFFTGVPGGGACRRRPAPSPSCCRSMSISSGCRACPVRPR
jgi:CDP-diacylglycerol---serine O-phosphatidyltransferase